MDQSGLNFNPPTGVAQELEPGLRRIVAQNPSPMTFRGTNTYLLGTQNIAVIDPGPDDASQKKAILSALQIGQKITSILVTHSHIDHSPLAGRLATETGAKIYAFGPTGSGQSQVMADLISSGYNGGGEGSDYYFCPDISLSDGTKIEVADEPLQVIHTPGHFGNHLCFVWKDSVFSGDHVMGWASTLVSPPDGDLGDFLNSCRKLQNRKWRIFYPGHGAPVEKPNQRLEWLIDHRLGRESQILKNLQEAPNTPKGLAEAIYTDTPSSLIGAAARNVFAHLLELHSRKLLICDGPPRFEKLYRFNKI